MRALVLDGGGMRGAFSAGVLACLREEGFDYRFFDYYVGSSSGACTMTYFLTDQIAEGLRIWQEHLPGKFMKWRGIVPQNDASYLEHIIRDIEPLSHKTLAARKEKAIIAFADPLRMRMEYKCLNEADDPVRILVDSTAMPFFSGPAMLDDHPYYDANIIGAVPLKYANLIGADETWVILTTPYGYRRKTWRWRIASWFARDKRVARLLSQRPQVENETLEEIEKRKDLIVIRPEKKLPVHWRNNNREAITQTIKIGKETAKKFLLTKRIK